MDSDKFNVQKLKDDNYEEWLPAIRAVLVLKGYWGLCEGREPENMSDSELAQAKEKAIAYITLSLDASRYALLGDFSDPKKVMDNIRKVHRVRGFGSRFKMLRLFLSMRMQRGENQSIISWINSVESYARRLRNIDVDIKDEFIITVLVNG